VINLFFDILAKPDRYLDPGSGSILVQLIIAALGGGLFFLIKNQWNKWLKKGKSNYRTKKETSNAIVKTTKLPKKCPNCGNAVDPKTVKWLDEATAECSKCGETLEGK
jgi:ribosomal protein S27AE